jgi:hypothetical protein
MEDIRDIQKETLELVIKAGRRLMHDFDHLLNEVPKGNDQKSMYEQRAKLWRNIFYPDDGPKNYRSTLHQEIMNLEYQLSKAKKLLIEHGIDINADQPF